MLQLRDEGVATSNGQDQWTNIAQYPVTLELLGLDTIVSLSKLGLSYSSTLQTWYKSETIELNIPSLPPVMFTPIAMVRVQDKFLYITNYETKSLLLFGRIMVADFQRYTGTLVDLDTGMLL